MASLSAYLEEGFRLGAKDSSISQEVAAGVSTFLTMSYVLLLNPILLAKVGLDSKSAVLATAIASSAATFISGFFGNLPFGSAPGSNLNIITFDELILL